MAIYEYEAMDCRGRETVDVVEADCEHEALDMIRKRGQFVTKIDKKKSTVTWREKKVKLSKPAKPMDANELGKKILLDTLVSPVSLVPAVLGATAIMASWAANLGVGIMFGGIVGILAGAGIAATRLIWGLDQQIDRAMKHLQVVQEEEQESLLNSLQERLRRDPDVRTRSALKELRELYASFQQDQLDGLAENHKQVARNVEELFRACVKQLTHSCELWEASRSMPERVRKEVLENRDKVIPEIVAAVDSLAKTVQEFHGLTAEEGASELSRLRQELTTSLDVAKRTEEGMASLEKPVDTSWLGKDSQQKE